MRWRMVRTLFRKEMLDTLRDRRTLLIMVLLPIVIYPLFGIIVSQAQFVQQRRLKGTRFVVGVVGALPHRLAKRLVRQDRIRTLASTSPWRAQLRKGELAVVLQIHQVVDRRKRASKAWPQRKIVGFYVSTRDSSRAVWRRVQGVLRGYQRDLLRWRLRHKGLSYQFVKPLVLVPQDIVSQGGRSRHALSLLFPTLLVILTVMGAFYPAIDLTAGEKERGTLETLLTAPVSSLEIVTGKYMAVTCIASFTGALNLLSLWFTFAHGIRMAGRLSDFQMGLHLGHYLAIFGFLVLVAALSSAMMIAIASLARSFKEGQNYVTPAYLMCLLPALMPSMPGAKASMITACLPIVNVAFAIQLTINGQITAWYLLMSLLSMLLSVALALVVAARIFSYEQVLFREGEFAFLGKKSTASRPWRPVPSVEEGFALLAGLFVLTYYVGMPLQQAQPAFGLGVQLWVLVFLLPIFFLRARKIEWRRTLRWQSCHPLALVGAIPMAVGAIVLVGALTEWLSPIIFANWGDFVSQANHTFQPDYFGVGPWAFFFLLAVSPGICEEVLFRGAILSSLRTRLRFWPAILLSALLFGAFHLHLYRLLPTTLLGVMLGWLCATTGSIWPAMLAHATNNGMALATAMVASTQSEQLLAYAPLTTVWTGIDHTSWQAWFVLRMSELTGVTSLLWGVGLFGLGAGVVMWANQRRVVSDEPAFQKP